MPWKRFSPTAFIDYMKIIWLSSHQNWYEGIAHNTPSHNNGLESNNLVIKKEETFRERMPLSRFLQQCILSGEKWSKQYSHNDKVFIDSHTIELQHWTAGYHWAKTNKEISSTAIGVIVEYYCPVGDESKVSEEHIKNVKELRWNTFDQFKKRASSVWIVSLPTVNEKWKEGKCQI